MLTFFLFVSLLSYINCNSTGGKISYNEYAVFTLTPTTEQHLKILDNYESVGIHLFWRRPTKISQTADLMVSRDAVDALTSDWDRMKMKYVRLVPNVQTLIDQESPRNNNNEAFGWGKYYSVDEIYQWLKNIPTSQSSASTVVAGKSFEGREIRGIRLTYGAGKPGVVLEGGIYGFDRMSPAAITYVLNELVSSKNAEVRKIAESFDWYIFPIVNPDGYQYSYMTDRFWRKTRSTYANCTGADMNSNFNSNWDKGKASKNPCSNTYRGTDGFSESETKALAQYVKGQSGQLSAYFSIYGYSQSLVYPCEITPRQLGNCKEMKTISQKAIASISKKHNSKYISGSAEDLNPLETATSTEWMKNALKLPIVYNYQFPNTKYGLLPPANLTIPNGRELLDVLTEILTEARKQNLIITYKVAG